MAPAYVRISSVLNSSVMIFCCSGVAFDQLRPMAICVVLPKLAFGRIFCSTSAVILPRLPSLHRPCRTARWP